MRQSIRSMSAERRYKFKQMKLQLCILTLVGLVAGSLAASAQTNPPAGDTTTTNAVATPSNDNAQSTPTADASAPAAAEAAADTAAQPATDAAAQPTAVVAQADAATNAPAADVAVNAPGDAATNAPAGEVVTNAPAGDASATNAPAQPSSVIPLIVMDDVPLTDAIKNLARQAGLNYILDPKVAFGQPGPDGRPVPQPSVSIRWENVTAAQALNALLGTYNLQLIED